MIMIRTRFWRNTALMMGGAALLSACATPRSRVSDALVQAGLERPVAHCMAGRMVDRLSLAQLRRMSDLGTVDKESRAEMTDAELAHRLRALRDPEVIGVTLSSFGLCTVREQQ